MSTSTDDFLRDFAAMSRHGATPGGGVERQAGSAGDHATRGWFGGWLAEHGFAEHLDAVGNQFGTLTFRPGAPTVLLGSHLDSQPLGGRYDGAYGVLAGAHAAARVAAEVAAGALTPVFNLAVVNWFNEEGSRFTPSMMGSAVFTGKMTAAAALATADPAGVTVAQALAAGHAPVSPEAPVLADVAQYAEIHIEQGKSMEERGITIGLVDRTWAASKYRVVVHGAQSHTGSTRMDDRRDALYGASLVIAAAREITEEFPPGQLHSSVSELTVLPNSPVTIAREVTMNLDLRSPDEAVLERAMALLDERIRAAEARSSTTVEHALSHRWGLLAYQPEGVELARAAAVALELSHTEIMTVAGHDSTNMKDEVPTVMLFVPSVDGVSHNEGEFTRDADAAAGVDLFTEVARRLVAGELPLPGDSTPA